MRERLEEILLWLNIYGDGYCIENLSFFRLKIVNGKEGERGRE